MLLLLIFLIVIFLLIYHYLTKNYNYWKRRKVPGPKSQLFFGNLRDIILFKTTVGEGIREIYNKFEEFSLVGIYEFRRPVLLLRSPKIIKQLLIKDFPHFQGRGFVFDESVDPLGAHLINLTGTKWRILRTKLTPAFTSVKIRNMFPLVAESAKKFNEHVKKYADGKEPIEMRFFASKFAINVISSCGFGLETNSIQDENSEFSVMCRKAVDPSLFIAIKRIIRMIMPGLFKKFKMYLNPQDVTQYFLKLVNDIITFRKANEIIRNDFMQILLQIKENYHSSQREEKNEVEIENDSENEEPLVIDEKVIAAQAYVFILAGFDTSSTTISFALLELAINLEIQDRLYQEIRKILDKFGTLTYDAVSEMEYLDRVVHETLRKHPPVGVLPRLCNKSCKIPETDILIEKGTKILVPVFAIHRDPIYYPDPMKFDPDRFLDENKKKREACTYLPFGEGPRNCIGMRFGYMQTKAGLISLLMDYEVKLSSKTKFPIEYEPTTNTLSTISGIWLSIHRRKDI